jgi:hypothetical protein
MSNSSRWTSVLCAACRLRATHTLTPVFDAACCRHSTGICTACFSQSVSDARLLLQTHPWLMAAACSDRFVRVYDRRRLSLCCPDNGRSSTALLSLAPLHLLGGTPRNEAHVFSTSARFSNRGDRIVATYHREQVSCSSRSCACCTNGALLGPVLDYVAPRAGR